MVKHVPQRKTKTSRPAASCLIHEYGSFGGGAVNATAAHIRGRYPEKGWAVNHECDEQALVLGGTGVLEMPGEEVKLAHNDVVFIPKGQKFAWRGRRLALFLSCVPAWTTSQYAILE